MAEEAANIAFVLEIEKYECLYNFNLPEYSRRDVPEKAWTEIAQQQNSTVSACQDKWKNIRSVFVRKKKDGRSGDGRKSTKPYYLNEYLQFLIPFVKCSTHTSGNLQSPPAIDSPSQTCETETAEPTGPDTEEPQQNIPTTMKMSKRKPSTSQVDMAFIEYWRIKEPAVVLMLTHVNNSC